MSKEIVTLYEIKFIPIENGNFFCDACERIVSKTILFYHSLQHKNGAILPQDQEKNFITNFESDQTISLNSESDQKNLKKLNRKKKSKIDGNQRSNDNKNKFDFFDSIQNFITNDSLENSINLINFDFKLYKEPILLTIGKSNIIKKNFVCLQKIKRRCIHVSTHRYFRKWKKIVNN